MTKTKNWGEGQPKQCMNKKMSYENCYFICDLKKYTNKKKDMFETTYYLRNVVAMFSSL